MELDEPSQNPHDTYRRSIRLPEYDYSAAGAYFVTVCIHLRENLPGWIDGGRFCPNALGEIVSIVWNHLPDHYLEVEPDAFTLMPNHIHGIIHLTSGPRREAVGIHGLPEIVRGLKSFSAREINRVHGKPGRRVWQRGYYESVIRNETQLSRLRRYVTDNPARWEIDRYHS
jgi:REP element-mobilizing transposase RayT